MARRVNPSRRHAKKLTEFEKATGIRTLPETLRATILHIPARLVAHARSRILKIEQIWPWAKAVIEAWRTPRHDPRTRLSRRPTGK
jgi:hypothetical protein